MTEAMAGMSSLATMARCDIHRMAHEAVFTTRSWDDVARFMADEFQLVDHPQGVTHGDEASLRAATEGWWAAFPDITLEGAEYWDTGDCTIMRGFVRGTQHAAMGPFPATGRSFVGTFVEMMWCAADGRVTRIEQVYDQLSMLIQLGHMPAPE